MDFKYTFLDYLKHPTNVETLNKYVDLYLKAHDAGTDLLNALKDYYEEFKTTHFMPVPLFDDFLDYLLYFNKLSKQYAEKLKLKNMK